MEEGGLQISKKTEYPRFSEHNDIGSARQLLKGVNIFKYIILIDVG